ncbi:hypothetical protein ACOSZF_23610 [Cytobacillus firmus]|uniref:Uncharacterized protein n=2 Tax=Bacillaceae TaxID=186817 RepID=D3FQU7_ALKPO|nr:MULTISPECIES: hypothetical protein [Bacillaceae]ADC51467.1 hypothetical protein BpOF4_17120 [Alkalihalophilus pseudofirmus OF4]ADC52283.1 hypothetical protein BpOF4_21439 [Alkalihalophilus pseudofirmus OF4]KAF0824986.1 hypothetical protein KIS1582_1188 [Cytobacillus firmus]MBG9541696.1 hypothetical protein [Cytobacillus firmus]MBG9543900.1 hypothetical protein [Cytobacillus firmus]
MIPEEVEIRIAKYFLHMYLPDEVMRKVEEKLLPPCIWKGEEELDYDELVRWSLEIINQELDGKSFK